MRPALYGAWHGIEPVGRRAPGRRFRPTSSGPVCETSDTLGRDRAAAAGRGRRPAGDPRHRRVRRGHGVELQSPADGRAKCMVDAGAWRIDPPAADDRRHAAVGRVMLIAFEGLDQSGKETQARTLRARLEQDGPHGALALVPRLRDADRPGDRARRSPASASSGPTSCSCSTSPTGSSTSRGSTLARRRRRRHLRSLSRVERRVRRSAGARCRLARRHPAAPARAGRHRASRHRARNRREAQGRRPRSLRARPRRCSRACARATAARPRSPAGCVIDAEQPKDDVATAVAAGRAATARATVSARTVLTPASSSTALHASSVAPVVITSSMSTTVRLRSCRTAPRIQQSRASASAGRRRARWRPR